MREKSEILEKFVEVRAAKLRERKQEYLCRAFMNCASNMRMRVKGKGQVGFCQNPSVMRRVKGGLFVCNDDDTARKCEAWSCRNTEVSVEQEFDEILKSPARCGEEYPKLAILIWCLQDFDGYGRGARLWYLVRKMAEHFWKIVSFGWW